MTTGTGSGSGPGTQGTTVPDEGGAKGPYKGYVWDRTGDTIFGFLTTVVLVGEAVVLSLLVWVLLFGSAAVIPGQSGMGTVLVGSVSFTAVLIAVVTLGILLLRWMTIRREERRNPSVASWAGTWRAVLDGQADLPTAPLPDDSVEALLELRESLDPPETERVAELIRTTGVDERLLDELDATLAAARHWGPRALFGRSHRIGAVLDRLDDLARARLPAAARPLMPLLESHDEAVRTMTVRTVARCIAAMPRGAQSPVSLEFLDHLRQKKFGRGEIDEALLLMEGGAEPLVKDVLAGDRDRPELVAACLDATRRLRFELPDPLAVGALGRDRPSEVRSAAFRLLASMARLPAGAGPAVRDGLVDDEEIVRIQAARAARLLPPDEAIAGLDVLLGDRSWWVRKAAAETLPEIPGRGPAALIAASNDQPDRYGRDMAAQVLRDRNRGGTAENLTGGRQA